MGQNNLFAQVHINLPGPSLQLVMFFSIRIRAVESTKQGIENTMGLYWGPHLITLHFSSKVNSRRTVK